MEIPQGVVNLIARLRRALRLAKINYVDQFKVNLIFYTTSGIGTSSGDFQNGTSLYSKGYVIGDISQPFEELYSIVINKAHYVIFTTTESITCCVIPGIRKESLFCKNLTLYNYITDVVIRQNASYQEKVFSGRTYYFGEKSMCEMPSRNQIIEEIRIDKISIIFTCTGSIYVKIHKYKYS